MCRMIDLVHMELSDLTTKFFNNRSDHLYTEFITFPFYLTVVENITK